MQLMFGDALVWANVTPHCHSLRTHHATLIVLSSTLEPVALVDVVVVVHLSVVYQGFYYRDRVVIVAILTTMGVLC